MGGVVQPRDDPSTQGISHSNSRNSTADHSRPSSSYENVSESLPSNFNVLLLQTPADAYFFDPNHLEHDPEKIKAWNFSFNQIFHQSYPFPIPFDELHLLSAGTLLYEDAKARGKEQIARRMSALRNNKSSNKDNCLAYDILNDSIFANVSQSNVMRITDNQALILMPVPSAERLNLHKDFSRMHFLETLKQGDIVQVLSKSDPCGSSDSMRSGRVEWIGEQQNRLGRLYGISSHNDFDSHFPTMSTDFHRSHAPKQIHYYPPHHVYPPQIPTHEHSIPTKSPISNFDRAAPSRTRVIPIERKDSPKSLSNSNSSFSPASSSHASLQPYYDREPFESAQYPRHGTRPNNSFDLLTNDGIPNPRTGGEQFENDIRNWNGGSSLRRKPSAEPEYSSFGRRDHSDNRSKEDIVRERRISGPGDQRRSREDEKSTNRETMLRSQSKSRLTASQSRDISHATISVDDPMLAQRVSVGDRCIWSGHPCTVRFIGYLKGHASIYAGVEFDDKVGKGTGAFEGETVFRTPDGHAGFVILSALEKLNDVPNSHDSRPPPPYHQVAPSKPEDFLINGLDIGSRVSANYVGAIQSGTVKWIGDSMSDERDRIMKCAVVQLDSEPPSGWRLASDDPDLSINFSEPRCVILPYNPQTLKACPTGSGSNGSSGDVEMADVSEPERVDFGNLDSDVQLTKVYPTRNKEDLIGRMKGIQGHRNSCYLDSMLFAMFSQTTVYDHLLDRIPRSDDVPQLKELQRILATEIVYPLRKSHYVRADHVMKVRELLQSILPNMKGLTTEEKDPEEIINEVFGKIFKAPHAVRFIKDNKIDSMHICPIIVEEWSQGIVTTQHLLERHMVASNVRFAEPPKTLIIQVHFSFPFFY
ncbi:hypothetical protein WR25_10595 isoform B [Diploscapter pachys]|uniref:ubiquitinyl hydrolase 1 n=1 Tax=Diploscapter pachys TaxID=2018661 RepID=A0A2A2JFH6_9BILA|nr:hypothetical protein WR25_10595 isoform B [Diploscapter pachys]